MIINTAGNNITVPYNNTCTYPLASPGLYGIPNLVAKLNGSSIFYLPTGQYLVKGNAANVTLPTIFTPSVISNIYQTWYMYYLYNDFGTTSTYNAAFIDSSGNVDLGYYNNSQIIGMQFASGSTTVSKIGVLGNGSINTTGNYSDTTLWTLTYYAQHNNPVGTVIAWLSGTTTTGNVYFVLDGVAATTQTLSTTTHTTLTFNFTVSDTQLNQHTLALHAWNSSSGYTIYVQFVSFA